MLQRLSGSESLKYFSFGLLQKNIVEPRFREVGRFKQKGAAIMIWFFKLEEGESIGIEQGDNPCGYGGYSWWLQYRHFKNPVNVGRICLLSLSCPMVVTLICNHLSHVDGCCAFLLSVCSLAQAG